MDIHVSTQGSRVVRPQDVQMEDLGIWWAVQPIDPEQSLVRGLGGYPVSTRHDDRVCRW